MSGFTRSLLLGMGCACAVLACSAKRLPPGTPPPEYETRTVEPWPPSQEPNAGVSSPPVLEPLDAGTEASPTAPGVPADAAPEDAGTPALSPSGS